MYSFLLSFLKIKTLSFSLSLYFSQTMEHRAFTSTVQLTRFMIKASTSTQILSCSFSFFSTYDAMSSLVFLLFLSPAGSRTMPDCLCCSHLFSVRVPNVCIFFFLFPALTMNKLSLFIYFYSRIPQVSPSLPFYLFYLNHNLPLCFQQKKENKKKTFNNGEEVMPFTI